MTTTQAEEPVSLRPRAGGLRPTMWVLAVILLLGAALPIAGTMFGATERTSGSPLPVGEGGVQLTPRSGWRMDPTESTKEQLALVKGGTTLTVTAEQNAAPLRDLWAELRTKVSQRTGIDMVSTPSTTATDAGVRGLRAPVSAPRTPGTAAVYSDGQTAVEAIADGASYPRLADDVTAMLRSLQFGADTAGGS
jgi:hypothetical protein